MTTTLTFQAPTRPLSINESNRLHWAERGRRLNPWKLAVMDAWRNLTPKPVAVCPVTVHVTIPFERAGRRDPHNYTGTVVKALIDQLVVCGLVPDDTAEWVTVIEPTLAVDKTGTVIVTIEAGV